MLLLVLVMPPMTRGRVPELVPVLVLALVSVSVLVLALVRAPVLPTLLHLPRWQRQRQRQQWLRPCRPAEAEAVGKAEWCGLQA